VKVDILHRRRDSRWRLIEVKSTTDVRDHHLEDVAIQYRVVSRSGLDVATACLGHINRNYIYPGGEIDPRRFFRIRNLTRRVQRLQPKLIFQLRSGFTVLAMPTAPDIASGRHCSNPVTCEFYERCNPPHPTDHIGYLPRIHASAMDELEAAAHPCPCAFGRDRVGSLTFVCEPHSPHSQKPRPVAQTATRTGHPQDRRSLVVVLRVMTLFLALLVHLVLRLLLLLQVFLHGLFLFLPRLARSAAFLIGRIARLCDNRKAAAEDYEAKKGDQSLHRTRLDYCNDSTLTEFPFGGYGRPSPPGGNREV